MIGFFANQPDLSKSTLENYASDIGLDLENYRRDVSSDEVRERLSNDINEARALGVRGTSGFFLIGRFLSGARPLETFK